MLLSDKLKQLREGSKQPQRRIASALDIDTGTYCKIENGRYIPSRDQVLQLSYIFEYDTEELIKLWLADRLLEVASKENMAQEAMQLVSGLLEKDGGKGKKQKNK